MENPFDIPEIDLDDLIETCISTLNSLGCDVEELFGENSEVSGFLANRSEFLHQFSVIASTFHQLHTVNFLENSENVVKVFETEISIAQIRSLDLQNHALAEIKDKIILLDSHLEKINQNISKVSYFLDVLKSESLNVVPPIAGKSKVNANLFSTNLKLQQSITFALEEIRSKVLNPVQSIIPKEIEAGQKIIDVIELGSSGKQEISHEELARMCELLSWGLDPFENLWTDVKTISNEVSATIKKEVSSLRTLLPDNFKK